MKIYSDELLNKFKSIIDEGELVGDKKRRQFAEKKVLPFYYELMDEIVSNDNLEKVGHELFKDNHAGMAIRTYPNGKKTFAIEENAFYSRWVEYSKDKGRMSKILKENILIGDVISVFHEERHLKQDSLRREKDFFKMSPYTFIYIKENLILTSDYNWYLQNHGSFWTETEAHLKSYEDGTDFIIRAIPDNKAAQRQEKDKNRLIKSLINPTDYMHGENPRCYKITNKFDQLLNKSVNSNPNVFKNILAVYPVLSIVYNPDGTKKDIKTILKTRNDLIKENKENLSDIIYVDDKKTTKLNQINNIFHTIIKSDKTLTNQYNVYTGRTETSENQDDIRKREQNIKTNNSNIKQPQTHSEFQTQIQAQTQTQTQTFERNL